MWYLSDSIFINTLVASCIAGIFTGFGGLAIFLKKKYSKNDINMMLNIAAGVMLAAAIFSLLVPAMEKIISVNTNQYIGAIHYCGAVFLGVALVWLLNDLLPHEHNHMGHHGPVFDIKKAWLFIIAISLHKLPEGLAVGVAYGAHDMLNPLSLVLGIAIHNIPEGLIMAIALYGAGKSKARAVFIALMMGMLQPIGALLGLLITGIDTYIIPVAMALAGGTLMFVVINEILPETYGTKKTDKSAAAVFGGFILMTFIFMVLH
ncbi:MAG: ZIP family metal transporter [Alphaproteobacteria bacterium]|nr:ZIP family metal transporter [Alphaproteobacteria bacterium]